MATDADAMALDGPPMAGGQPLAESVADAAAQWLTVLMCDQVTEQQRQRFERWRGEHADHERAWRHIETVRGRLAMLQPAAAYQALVPHAEGDGDATRSRGRRNVLRALFWGGTLGAGVLIAARSEPWRRVAADHRTATGERREIRLDDGTAVTLNTATALDVRFDARQRLLRLVAGEILLASGHARDVRAEDARPLVVETGHGHIRAMGTRFAVRRYAERTQVTVIESAVEVTPRDAFATSRVVRAREQTSFNAAAIDPVVVADDRSTAWLKGQIVADDLPLAAFVDELSRYRPGVLRCAGDVAALRLSGVFPLEDTDRILAILPRVLPVRVRWRTRYWVTVEPAAA